MNQLNLIDRANQYARYLRAVLFDPAAGERRAQERQRKIVFSVLASFAAKVVTSLTSLLSIRLAVHYLGQERFGMWALIGSFAAMLTFADLGIGNGLLNSVSGAYGRDDRESASRSVSTAFYILALIAAAAGIAYALAYRFIAWPAVFNVSSARAVMEAGPAMSIFIACLLINIPLGVVQRIRLGYQEGYVNSFWLAVGGIATLLAVVLLTRLQAGLPALVLALAGPPIVAQVGNGLNLFFRGRSWLLPRWSHFSIPSAKSILRLGFLFFVLQMAVALCFESDSFIITQYMGAQAVTQYAIPKRLFALASGLLSMVVSPLWPAYSEALTRRDVRWTRRTLRRSLIISGLLGVASAVTLLVFSKPILQAWVGDAVSPPRVLLAGFAGWLILFSVLNPFAMLMNGAGIIGFQIVSAIVLTVVNIVISIILVQQIGVAGPIWGTVISLAVCTLLPTILYVRGHLDRLEKRSMAPVSDKENT